MKHIKTQVEIWEEKVMIPTYGVGEPDKNPMFLEKRVYQGSSGKVYPLPVIDKIFDEKREKEYNAVFLENDYIRVMVLPELGGRIQRAYDKTNGYDFVYYNEVIKPALVGLVGPWLSGGIEFNWPQHHRPTTYARVDYVLSENEDGSKTLQCSEVDQMYGTKGKMSFTLYPDRAYIEIKGQLYNRTNMPQTFLWWANPAVAVNDNTQSIFPPDVRAVFDHGKRDVSKFPIATGVYYKHDYGAGVDISRYKNIPVPTSYMCHHSDYNFVGGYDYGVDAGILHIADHHISPGKKQWTWGCGDFGKAWDRNLTDENGPYIELMTGVYTDNQPDFTWLKPFEEKTFTQYFMPYKKVGKVKNASTEVIMALSKEDNEASLVVYATGVYKNARILLRTDEEVLLDRIVTISPVEVFEEKVETECDEKDMTLSVYDENGRHILSYRKAEDTIEEMPEPAQPAKLPSEIMTNEELYLTGLHIEQYRHATYLPEDYYLEGLKRDPKDIRINNAYGLLLLRRGDFEGSEKYFRNAIERLTWKNPNPYNSEAFYNLGLACIYQGKDSEAFDAFYKATWTAEQQEMSFYYLAAISTKEGRLEEALYFIEKSLVKNGHNLKARALKGLILESIGNTDEAKAWFESNLAVDAFDYVSRFELARLTGEGMDETILLAGGRLSTYIECAIDYADAGYYEQAVEVLKCCNSPSPLLKYYLAFNLSRFDEAAAKEALKEAAECNPYCCFPNKLEDIIVLKYAIENNPSDSKAPYYLGNEMYDKRQYTIARELWEKSVELCDSYPTAWRNLSLAYFNKEGRNEDARKAMEKAFSLDTTDARIFLELDQLYSKLGMSIDERLARYEKNRTTFEKRDDLCVEYATILNLKGRYEEAYNYIMARKFHPWEGGEGKVTTQYTTSLVMLAKKALADNDLNKAKEYLEKSLVFPDNLGEGKLEGEKDNNIYYYLGLVHRALGDEEKACEYLERASISSGDPAGMMYYNDQPADMILFQGLANRALNREEEALGRFHKLIDYGEKHIFDKMKIDYFAVSLPDLQLFDEDLTIRNQAHCYYLMGLGYLGMGDDKKAKDAFEKTLNINPAHQGAILYRP